MTVYSTIQIRGSQAAKILVIATASIAFPSWSTPFLGAQEREEYYVFSGVHDGHGQQGPNAEAYEAFSAVIEIPSAEFLRVYFGDHQLGDGSFIEVTAIASGEEMRFDSKMLQEWSNSSPFVQGDAVTVSLHVAPADEGVFFEITALAFGFGAHDSANSDEAEGGGATLCGADDRVASNDPRVGRLHKFGVSCDIDICPPGCTAPNCACCFKTCTAWLVSNGAFLTAGHCDVAAGDVIQFNVPPSIPGTPPNCEARPTFAALVDQYPVTWVTAQDNRGVGNDWAVFAVGRNAVTGERPPIFRAGEYYRMELPRDVEAPQTPTPIGNVRVVGYGRDEVPPPPGCPAGTRNADDSTQQEDQGPWVASMPATSNDVVINYAVDTAPGTSGSPVAIAGMFVALGIHTNGTIDCQTAGQCWNCGTSFENDDLEAALRDFTGFGPNIVHVDTGHPVLAAFRSGTVFRPFAGIAAAYQAVPAGGALSIVEGRYPGQITLGGKGATLLAPVGPVVIGSP